MYVIMRGQWIRGSELGGCVELGERTLEGCVVFPEVDRKIDDDRPDVKAGKQVLVALNAGLHGRAQHDVRAGNQFARPGARSQAREHGRQQDAVQGEENVAVFGGRSGERGGVPASGTAASSDQMTVWISNKATESIISEEHSVEEAEDMNRREMLTTTGAATLGALCMPKLMRAEAPASQVAIVRCRDYAQYGQQLSSAFDQIGGIDKLVRGKTVASS